MVPKTTLRFEDLLGGLTELRKAVMFTVKVCYSERYRLKSAKEKGTQGRVQALGFSCTLPVES